MVAVRRFMLDTTNIPVSPSAAQARRCRHGWRQRPWPPCVSLPLPKLSYLFALARRPEATALKTAVQAFLRHVEVLPWDRAAATAYSELRATLESQGTPLANLDTLIAAHALAIRSTLVSNDKALARTPRLQVEDWTFP